MAALGAAIGTGNIWRFPKEVANNGGGSFMIPYVIFLFIWSIPILLVEFNLGKKSRRGTMGTFAQFLGIKKTWMGAWLTWISTAIGFYYAVVMGWTLRYALGSVTGSVSFHSAQGARDSWEGFLGSPLLVVFFQVLAIAITVIIVYRGVEKGVERVNKVLIPALFVLLIIGMIRALLLPGAFDGIAYLFTPHMGSLLNARTWISALAQSAWSCSAGMGMAITYGAYTKRKSDTNLNTFLTGLGDTTIALVAGIMIFATVFAVSPSPAMAEAAVEEGGSGLTFIYLPSLFGEMAGGPIIAVFFFMAMAFAALTSMIATYENAVKNFVDAGWDRKKAIRLLTVGMLILGLPSALIILPVSGTPLPVFLDNQDFVWGLGLIVSGAFIYYLVVKYGITRFRNNMINSRYDDIKVGRWFDVLFKFIIPIELAVMSGWFLIQTLTAPSEEWWLGGVLGLGILLLQWGVSLAVLIFISKRVGPRMIDEGMDMGRSIDDDIDILEGPLVEVLEIREAMDSEGPMTQEVGT
ncbi:MAG: sodium-dependent transporter [Candidatus Thermoplasmatota archaeon]|nr:sodium-dependent transporter [Candidatus Thermoplasmatota archaeon]